MLDPERKRLLRKSLETSDEFRYDIKSQDTCFTLEGMSFQRFMIDGTLDDRCCSPSTLRKQSTRGIANKAACHTADE